MLLLVRRIFSYLIIPVCWTILTIVLLCLPGSAVPESNVFKIESIDEIAHVVLFGGMVLCWGLFFSARISDTRKWLIYVVMIVLIVILIGTVLEYIQLNYIPQRGFEILDIIINTISSTVAGVFLFVTEKKFRRKKEIKWPLWKQGP